MQTLITLPQKLKFSLYRAIRVCFTWIAKCALHPQPPTTYSHSKLPALDPRNRHIDELLVIGSLCLRKDFWDRHGANIATRWNEMYVKGVSTSENTILETDYCFFYQKWIWVMLIQGKCKLFFWESDYCFFSHKLS